MLRGLKTFQSFSVVCGLSCSLALEAQAANFGSGGGIYYANVACRVDDKGAFATTATASYAGGASQSDGNVSRLIDTLGPNADNAGGWLITGLKADGAVATATIDLGQVWNLRQIQTDYGNWLSTAGLNYQLNLSTDGTTWTTVVGPKAIGGNGGRPENIDTFTATDARYIQWQIIGASTATPDSLLLSELGAYVSSDTAAAPQKDGGFNIARGLSADAIVSSGFANPVWLAPAGLFDGALNNDGGLLPGDTYPDAAAATGAPPPVVVAGVADKVAPVYLSAPVVQQAVVDLGASYNLVRLSQDFYDRWPDGSLEISNDKLKWTVIKEMGTPMTDGTWVFAPQMARYIRISGAKSSARMQELQAFPAGPAIPK